MYLESYTSILCYGLDKSQLEEFYGREVIDADRTCVEQQSGKEGRGREGGRRVMVIADVILENAHREDVVLLVVGDPFGATTHTDLVLR